MAGPKRGKRPAPTRSGAPAAERPGVEPMLDGSVALAWTAGDWTVLAVLTAGGGFIRFWRIGGMTARIFDEKTVHGQALKYLRGGPPVLSQHPPLGKLLVALGMLIFGDNPFGWRICNGALGTLLIAITYLLARRMFQSRLTAALAAGLVAIEGLLFVLSRTAMIHIVYLTLIALGCLVFFVWRDATGLRARRAAAAGLGLAIGLCLGAKFGISAVAALWLAGFACLEHWRPQAGNPHRASSAFWADLAIAGGVAALAYTAVFTPFWALGWWHSPGELVSYNLWVLHSHLNTMV